MPKIPFLTPPSTSLDRQCRTLRTPTNKEWLGVFNSALLEMTNPYNWLQVHETDLSIEDTIALVEEILLEFFATPDCGEGGSCTLPDLDTPPFRIGINGRFEWLNPDTGEWGAPEGEYAIPPTPAREEPTPYERKCAAAANAANVLKLVYEAITDEIAMGGDTLQVAAAMVAALVTAVGGWIAAPVYAIIQLSIALFAGVVEILQVLGADVWTADFDEKMRCALLACASETGDVVTFDLECLRLQLTVEPDLLDPDWFYDLQLFAQMMFLIDTIGKDGLDAAGATTAIVGEDCAECGNWCYAWDLTETDGEFVHIDGLGTGNWVSGTGWVGAAQGGTIRLRLKKLFPADITITAMHILFDMTPCGGSPAGGTNLKLNGSYVSGAFTTSGSYSGSNLAGDWVGSTLADEITWEMRTGVTGSCGSVVAKRLVLEGTGDNPFGVYNCF